jgi:hypothetical protein
MELASMLAHEPFSDCADSVSSTIGAFLRTFNDGLDDVHRQPLSTRCGGRRHDCQPRSGA